MKEYHVEFVSPVEIEFEPIRARSGKAAIETALKIAGYKNAVYAWAENTGLTYPDGKRPAQLKYREKDTFIFIHAIAWTI